MDSTVLCIDDRPQMLEIRKATLEPPWVLRQTCIERRHLDEDVGEHVSGRGSAGIQTGRHGLGSLSQPYQTTVSQPADYSTFRVFRDARANSLVGG
jgi:hypothetical protein